MLDALVAIEDREREQDRTELPGAEEHRGRLRRCRGADRHAVTPLDAAGSKQVRGLGGEGALLRPADLTLISPEIGEQHRGSVAGLAVADLGGDVVALGDPPPVRPAGLFIGERSGRAHLHSPPSLAAPNHARFEASPNSPIRVYYVFRSRGFHRRIRSSNRSRWPMQNGEEDDGNAAELDSEPERQAFADAEQPGAPRWQRH